MGEVQMIAATPEQALDAGIQIATKVAACAPLGIKATLNSAHLAPDQTERLPLSKLSEQYIALHRSDDFLEGRRAEADGQPPVYRGR
jgi:enoyl-CoA hydratase/carnithine racemase